MNTQDWSPSEWTGWTSLQSKGLSRVFSSTTVQKHQFLRHSAFFTVQLSHPYMTTGKTIALTRRTFVDKLMSLLLNMLSRLVITFLPRSKHLLISWLQSDAYTWHLVVHLERLKDWCWSWNSNTLAPWCEELTHLKRPWCWERLKAGGEGDDRVWDGWMASPTQWTWVSVNSGSRWWTRRPRVLQSMWLQRDTTEQLNWTELERLCYYSDPFVICKEREGSKVFPCLQTNKLPCYRFTGTSRRPRLLGQCHRTLLATKAELPRWHSGKESTCQCRRCKRRGTFLSWKTPWSRKWQCAPVFLLENSMDWGAWWATVHGVAKSQTWLRTWLEWWSMHVCTHTPIPQEPQFQLFIPLPWAPFPTEWCKGDQIAAVPSTRSWLHHSRGSWVGNSNLIMGSRLLTFDPKGDIILIIPEWKQTSLLLRGEALFLFPVLLTVQTSLKRYCRSKTIFASAHEMLTVLELLENCLSTKCPFLFLVIFLALSTLWY